MNVSGEARLAPRVYIHFCAVKPAPYGNEAQTKNQYVVPVSRHDILPASCTKDALAKTTMEIVGGVYSRVNPQVQWLGDSFPLKLHRKE